ncbi:MAG: c-type cytochrome [Verrucomicrobiales bacterium]|nr:c-type cytochrome [Verrucomicrobiales bacterium]
MHRLIRLLLFSAILSPLLALAAEAAPEAKAAFDLRAFLAPFHTVTLHLPIGFVMMAAILEGYHFLRPSRPLRNAIGVVLAFSAVTAVIVVLLGIFRADGGGYEPETLEHHRWYGIAVGALTIVIALVHPLVFRTEGKKAGPALYRAMLLGDLVLLSVAGHGGGNLTHGSKYLTENAPGWVKEWVESSDQEGHAEGGAPAGGGEFATVIRPIFEKKCFQCHGPEKQKGDYRMDTVEGLFAAGESELDPIVKKSPMESYLIETITLPEDDDMAMPPDGKDRLTPEETLAVIRWIWDGAKTD